MFSSIIILGDVGRLEDELTRGVGFFFNRELTSATLYE
jgi:hypothetical protein